MDVGFLLALSFHHGDLEPDCVEGSTKWGGGGLLCGIKIPLQDFPLKMQGYLCARRSIFAGHYGTCKYFTLCTALSTADVDSSEFSLVPRHLKNRRGAPSIHCSYMRVKIRYIFRIIY